MQARDSLDWNPMQLQHSIGLFHTILATGLALWLSLAAINGRRIA